MSKFDRTIRKLSKTIRSADKAKTKPYDEIATVKRIEGQTAWVHIPGGIDETPVRLTISAEVGDTVQIRVGGGRAWITGNQTAPPTDDKVAKEAKTEVNAAVKILRGVKIVADAAARIANNINQYFWFVESGSDTGAHITNIPQDEFLADPTNGGGNLLANSSGIAVRDGLTELATFGANEISLGNNSSSAQIFFCDEKGKIYYSSSTLVLSGTDATGMRTNRASVDDRYAQVAAAANSSQLAVEMSLHTPTGTSAIPVQIALEYDPTAASGQRYRIVMKGNSLTFNGNTVLRSNNLLCVGTVKVTGLIKAGRSRKLSGTVSPPSGFVLAGIRQVTTNHPTACMISGFGTNPSNDEVFTTIYNGSRTDTDYRVTVTIEWFGLNINSTTSVSEVDVDLPDGSGGDPES